MITVNLKTKTLLLTLFVLFSVSLGTILSSGQNPFDFERNTYKPGVSYEMDIAVAQAQSIFSQKKKLGLDFSDGPCLTNDLMQGWVADIVHTPREKVDNLSENRCPAYIEGRAQHFVELDLSGEVVRVR